MKVLCLFEAGVDRSEFSLLLGLRDSGVEPWVVARPGGARVAELKAAGIHVELAPMGSKIDPATILRIRRLLSTQDFDLVHAFRKRAFVNFGLARLGMRSPPVVAYRGIIGNLSYWDPFAWLTFLNPRVARIICVCDAIKQYFLDKRFLFFFSFFDEKNVVRIYKGHRTEWYAQTTGAKALRQRLGIPEGARVIGCVSRVKARKGIRELIRAMDLLQTQAEVHLVVLGKIEDQRHRAALRASRCRDRIHLLGFQPDASRLAVDFDVITLPSLRREGLPRAIIEGMSQGIPPVVTDSGGSAELVESGISGLVVPAGDPSALAAAFDRLLSDDEARVAMGLAARQRIASHFSIEATVAATLGVYHDVVHSQQPCGVDSR
jgi:glycosyltransferase involved in cell wall biosynthesis